MSCGVCGDNFIAVFKGLDTASIAASPGYDDIAFEPKLELSGADDRIRTIARKEIEYRIRVQVDSRSSDRLEQMRGGKQRNIIYELTAYRNNLIDAGYIDANGDPVIRTRARLEKIEDLDGNTVQTFPNPPGLYVFEVITDGWVSGLPAIVTWLLSSEKQGVNA